MVWSATKLRSVVGPDGESAYANSCEYDGPTPTKRCERRCITSGTKSVSSGVAVDDVVCPKMSAPTVVWDQRKYAVPRGQIDNHRPSGTFTPTRKPMLAWVVDASTRWLSAL